MKHSLVETFENDNPELSNLLKQLSGSSVYLYPNPGNAGDSLIATATYQILSYYQINYKLLLRNSNLSAISNSIIFLGGGGNLVPPYQDIANMLKMADTNGNHVIVLPHSIRGNQELLQQLTPNVTLFCREAASYHYAQYQAPQAKVCISHDLAFYVDTEELLTSNYATAGKHKLFELVREVFQVEELCELNTNSFTCFRNDCESFTKPELELPNYDISKIFRGGVVPGKAETSSFMFLEFISYCSSITSNRLHACIAACLVGTNAYIHDNSYGKVSAVYLHSIKKRFVNCCFAGPMVMALSDTALS